MTPTGNLKEGVHMTTEINAFEQNIALNDKISSADELKELNKKIAYCENSISSCSAAIDPRRVGTFRYFWPFLTLSLVIGGGGILFIFMANFLDKARAADGVEPYNYPLGLIFLGLVAVFMILHIIGGLFARHKCDAFNTEMNRRDDEIRAQIRKYENHLAKLNLAKKEYMEASAVTSTPAVVERKESPADLAAAITAKKEQISANERAIAEYNSQIIRINSMPAALKRTSMYYFWPFLVTSLVSFNFIQSICFSFLYRFNIDIEYPLSYVIAAHGFILLHVFGGIFARKMRDRYNTAANEKCAARFAEASTVREDLTSLEYQRKQLYEELRSLEESAKTT